MNVYIFGAGRNGKLAAKIIQSQGHKVTAFIDNNVKLQGKEINEIPVCSLAQYKEHNDNEEIIVASNLTNQGAILAQLVAEKIRNYRVFDRLEYMTGELFISYAQQENKEDVILYHVFKDEREIFYIDVGSNDPVLGSVTKALYDKGAKGINVEPINELWARTEKERKRDINLNLGLGKEDSVLTLYIQEGLSTFCEENVKNYEGKVEVPVTTLEKICEKYLPEKQEISFLKVDVEGFEKEVLQGGNFAKYRPFVVVMEATDPCTEKANYQNWEDILLDNEYHFVYEYGVNRYYVANEKSELDKRFITMEEMDFYYNILTMLPFDKLNYRVL